MAMKRYKELNQPTHPSQIMKNQILTEQDRMIQDETGTKEPTFSQCIRDAGVSSQFTESQVHKGLTGSQVDNCISLFQQDPSQ